MKPSTCETITKALDAAFKVMGVSFPEGMKILGNFHKNAGVQFWKRHRNLRAFKAYLVQAPEMTQRELSAFLALFELFPWMVREAVDQHFPPDPGGKSFILSEEEAERACSDIQEAIDKKTPPDEAIKKVAGDLGVDWRTMSKLWHGGLDSVAFQKSELKRRIRAALANAAKGNEVSDI